MSPVRICTGCGLRQPVPLDPPPRTHEEITQGYSTEDRPCPNERCKGTLKFYATPPRLAARTVRLASSATALALLAMTKPEVPLERPPTPGVKFRPKDVTYVGSDPALRRLAEAGAERDMGHSGHVSPGCGGGGRACPDACGVSCPYHGKRNAKLARRATRGRR
jgi:hypothetical protein